MRWWRWREWVGGEAPPTARVVVAAARYPGRRPRAHMSGSIRPYGGRPYLVRRLDSPAARPDCSGGGAGRPAAVRGLARCGA